MNKDSSNSNGCKTGHSVDELIELVNEEQLGARTNAKSIVFASEYATKNQ